MRSIGAAVVGTGFIGPVHVEAIRRLGFPVRGILGSTPDKGIQAAQSLGLPRAYSTFEELLADPTVQVVHLASPNRFHFNHCRQAVTAGKHVVCEKPLAMSSTQTAELVKLASSAPVVTAVNYNIRFYPLVLEARDRVRSGGLGEIFHITGSYLQDWLLHATDYNWRVQADEGGDLRALADIGTHWLDTIGFMTGFEVEAVLADLSTVHPTRQRPVGGSETFSASSSRLRPTEPIPVSTEDYATVLLRFRGGAKGCLTVSQVTAGRKNCLRFDVAGSRSSLAWNSEEPNTMILGHRDRPNETLTRDPGLTGTLARTYTDYPGGHAEGFPDTFKQLYKAVYADIANGKSAEPLYATFADGHREAQLCEAMARSHREQCWVTVGGE